jgi:hypothetical protein
MNPSAPGSSSSAGGSGMARYFAAKNAELREVGCCLSQRHGPLTVA